MSASGGAGRVHPNTTAGKNQRRWVYNGAFTLLAKDTIVTLNGDRNAAGLKALAAQPSLPAHWAGEWAVCSAGIPGGGLGNERGQVVPWKLVAMDTSSKAQFDGVYVDDGTPGALTLVSGAFNAKVGIVLTAATEADGGLALIYPELYRKEMGSLARMADVVNGATYPADEVLRSSIVQVAIPAGAETRVLDAPSVLGQEITFTAISDAGGSVAITAASEINQATNTTMTLADVQDTITLRAYTIAGTADMRWRVLFNDGVALS